ncbi:hypothetical protein [Streptomyces herbicida]|uniref:hypothetical protein n=1 Tax=Streptomyces herbicida TaxID=3065675 RepID=UPI0029319208|nr:hypothetical protein [Streptomyces sp. NEAU-HV9]
MFETIGQVLDSTIMPPANASALHKAVEGIPGVTEIPDAVDAAGRHGIGIEREDASSAIRNEWISDKDTLAHLAGTAARGPHSSSGPHSSAWPHSSAGPHSGAGTHSRGRRERRELGSRSWP